MMDTYRELPILYVHDDPRTLIVLNYVLGDQFTVYSATTLSEVVQLLERERVALVLCEHRMHGVASGLEICERVREIRPDVALIVTTTHAGRELTADAINASQIAGYVIKPWHDPDFVDLLRSTLDAYRVRSMKPNP